MGLKINNLKYKKYKKNIFNDLNFDINNNEILGIYFENKISELYFLKLLLGKKKPCNGKIYLNNKNITTLLSKERKIEYISLKLLIFSFLITKLRIFFYILKTPNFFYNSLLKYINTNFFYKNLLFIGNDLNKQDLILKTEKIINEYFNNSINIKKKWIKNYLIQNDEFNKKEINKILYDNKDSILFQSLNTFLYKKEEIRVYEEYLTFLQSLWDKIYYINDLDYLCDCYEISKKRKDKNEILDFIGAKLICEKYLKILNIEIIYQRYFLFKIKKVLKKYRSNVINIVSKNIKYKNIVKDILNKKNSINIINWTKLLEKKWFIYNEKQEQLISNLLLDEAIIIKGKILEYFHIYHLKLLNNTLEIREKNNYIEIKKAKEKNITVYNQIFEEVKKIIKKLNIKINWFKIIKNLNNVNYIKIKLVNVILGNKELIILYNIFDNLTKNEADEINNILFNLKKHNNKLTFLVFTKNIENIKNYVNKLLFFDNKNNYKLILKK